MRAPVQSGDRVVVWGGGKARRSFMPSGTLATVDYLLPDYGKIICKLNAPIGVHTSCCLYDDQYGYYWGLASGIAAATAVETGNTDSTEGKSPTAESGDAQTPSPSRERK